MKLVFRIILSVILAVAAIFFGVIGIKAAVKHTAYKDELVNVFKGQPVQEEVQEPVENENQIETENAIIQFNI